jgi:hypothetical protein
MAISVYVVDYQSVTKHMLQGDVRFVEAFELIGIPHYPDDEEKSKANKIIAWGKSEYLVESVSAGGFDKYKPVINS